MPPSLPYIPRTIRTEDSIVHLEYDPQRLPAAPGPSWTRFVCISDTHARTFHVPDGDVLLHSGDITNLGIVKEFEDMAEWLYSLPHKVKIIIAGNHDLTLHEEWYEKEYQRWHRHIGKQDRAKILELFTGQRAREAGIVYLQDSSYQFQIKPEGRTWNIYGSPWSPYFHNWAFNYHRRDADAFISKIPATDILLTHGPPARILDLTRTEAFAGCAALRAQLPRIRPRIHVFGHIHEARGAHVHAWDSGRAGAGAVSYNKDDGHAGSDGEEQEGDGLPEVNDFPSDDDDDDDDLDDLDVHFDDEDVGAGDEGDEIDERGGDECPGKDTANRKFKTVFVNAANYPTGKGAWRATQRVPSGGPGFQAVIVDVRDY